MVPMMTVIFELLRVAETVVFQLLAMYVLLALSVMMRAVFAVLLPRLVPRLLQAILVPPLVEWLLERLLVWRRDIHVPPRIDSMVLPTLVQACARLFAAKPPPTFLVIVLLLMAFVPRTTEVLPMLMLPPTVCTATAPPSAPPTPRIPRATAGTAALALLVLFVPLLTEILPMLVVLLGFRNRRGLPRTSSYSVARRP